MKNMKTFKYILFAGLLVLAASCVDEIVESEIEAVSGKMITECVTAVVSNGDTKAKIADNGTFSWKVGDHIAVHVSNGDNHKYVFSSDPGASGASGNSATATFWIGYEEGYTRDAFAIYPSSLVSATTDFFGQSGKQLDVNLPKEYKIDQVSGTTTPCPMIAANSGDSWVFSQLCGLLRLKVSSIPEGTSYLKVDFNGRKVSGKFSIDAEVMPGTSTIASVVGTKGEDDFILITGITTESSVDINIPLPTGAPYRDLIVSAWNSNDCALKALVMPFTYNASNAKGKKITAELKSGVFPIATNTKYIVFSPGNLQAETKDYGGTNWSWVFADDVKSKSSDGNASINGAGSSSMQNCSVDLFSWVGNGTPYTLDVARYGITNSVDATYFAGETLASDWGQLAIGDYQPGTWRTPAANEWTYIAQWTLNYSGCAAATVNYIKGAVLLPMHFVLPDGLTYERIPTELHYNSYSADDWKKLESAGAVFLPLRGYRQGNNVYDAQGAENEMGYYWTSSTRYPELASCGVFSSNLASNTRDDTPRYNGLCVRLIREL